MSLCAYVNQSDYMSSKKRAGKYSKKHKSVKVEKGRTFIPEIGGWTFIGMQIRAAIFVYIAAIPVSLYLQFKNFEIYEKVHMKFFIGIIVDTYIIAFFNGIIQLIIDFIYDCSNDVSTIEKTILSLKIKDVICVAVTTSLIFWALYYYFKHYYEIAIK